MDHISIILSTSHIHAETSIRVSEGANDRQVGDKTRNTMARCISTTEVPIKGASRLHQQGESGWPRKEEYITSAV